MSLSYRKQKDGTWAVFGPAKELRTGSVTVRKKDGTTKTENVVKVSKSFDVDGVPHAFGYLEDRGSSNGHRQRGESSRYCGYPCPVTGMKCCAKNGPCHDCQ